MITFKKSTVNTYTYILLSTLKYDLLLYDYKMLTYFTILTFLQI